MTSFSIITTCKARLGHLKRSLPRMIELGAAEVIVVDYSCPEASGDYVERECPAARVVRVEGEAGFSNWKARNAGAAVAASDMLVFCDADTILAPNALSVIANAVPEMAFGHLAADVPDPAARGTPALSVNQVRGFQVVPASGFRAIGGYDELFSGYAAGGDTDLENRLILHGLSSRPIPNEVIEEVIAHDVAARLAFHEEPVSVSYLSGLIYRRMKAALIGASLDQKPALAAREKIYALAREAAGEIVNGTDSAVVKFSLGDEPVGMPRQLGWGSGEYQITIQLGMKMSGRRGRPS